MTTTPPPPEPVRVHVVRYLCPFCRRGHWKKPDAIAHMDRCWYNPANRACATCHWYQPATMTDTDHGSGTRRIDDRCTKNLSTRDPADPQRLRTACTTWAGLFSLPETSPDRQLPPGGHMYGRNEEKGTTATPSPQQPQHR